MVLGENWSHASSFMQKKKCLFKGNNNFHYQSFHKLTCMHVLQVSLILSFISHIQAVKSLQTAESTIETLNQQLAEMGASDSLSRARVEHDRVLAGVQQRHDKEVKVLKEKIENLTDKLNEVVSHQGQTKLILCFSGTTVAPLFLCCCIDLLNCHFKRA